ncbi:MAG: baseplate J/gp47 family protein [Chloroflexota bacterium]|nr:baseplate J/gp47 family protein [Chloroflexota bacterium]
MAVWYLDNDDEITDAVARLRGATDERVVFVVPPGSRIATGRINFKLLAREAESRALEMAIASPDEQVRALATSAGVLAAPTADEAEAALERGDEPPTAAEAPDAEAASASTTRAPERSRGILVWSSQRIRFATIIVLALVIIGAFVAWRTLPTAEITLTPLTATLGPIEVQVVASASIAEPDLEDGRIPAVELPIPLTASSTFTASGVESIESHAAGEVVFSSAAQAFDQEIVAGTRLRTPAGVEFQTTGAVTLPHTPRGGDPSQVNAAVEAIEAGDEGNVPAGAITIVPSLENQGISVSNPEATSGGRVEETPVVTTQDYDAAAVDLQNRLAGALAAHLEDPASVPEGLTVYAETAQPGTVRLDPPADALVGTDVGEFELSGEVVASVLAVDTRLVDEVTQARLLAAMPEGADLLAGSLTVGHGEGSAEGQLIRFSGSGSAETYPLVDADEVVVQVAGLPISEAQAILEKFGTATVSVWPDFVGDLPDDHQRITLDVTEPSNTE